MLTPFDHRNPSLRRDLLQFTCSGNKHTSVETETRSSLKENRENRSNIMSTAEWIESEEASQTTVYLAGAHRDKPTLPRALSSLDICVNAGLSVDSAN